MAGVVDQGGEVPGYRVPLHRALSEPILLGGAPRAIAIMNGTLASAAGLDLRLRLIGIASVALVRRITSSVDAPPARSR